MSADNQSSQRRQASPASSTAPVRLPRLELLDDDSSRSPSGSLLGRQRSSSSASYQVRPPPTNQPMAAFTSWSAQSAESRRNDSRWMVAESSSSSSRPIPMPSSSGSSALREGYGHPLPSQAVPLSTPELPKPHRRSTMMSGALPPLATLQSSASGFGHLPPMYHPAGPGPEALVGDGDSMTGSSFQHNLTSSYRPNHPDASTSYRSSDSLQHGRAHHSMYRQPSYPHSVAPSDSTEATASSRKPAKAHVSSACLNCKRAHLACDAERPCRRCSKLGKTATCVDVQHKKRGRPRLKERETAHGPTSMKRSPHLASSGSTDSSWSPRTDPSSYFVGGAAMAPAWSTSPEAQDLHSTFSTGPEGRSRTFSAASVEMIAMNRPSHASQVPIVTTVLCGTDLIAAHVSQESQILFGLMPSQLRRRSLLDLVYAEDIGHLHDAWARLLNPVGLGAAPFPPAGLDLMQRMPCKLLLPARGTIFVEQTIRLRTPEGHYAPCSVRLHLGGTFGLDLYRPETKEHAFVVCSIVPIDERDTGATAQSRHPDGAQINAAECPPVDWRGEAMFRSPVGSPPTASMAALSVQSRSPHRPQHQPVPRAAQRQTSPQSRVPDIQQQGKRSAEGDQLFRHDSPSVHSSPSSRRLPGLAEALNISPGAHKSLRGSFSSQDSFTSSASSMERYGEKIRTHSGDRVVSTSLRASSPLSLRHGQQQHYNDHRPFSSTVLPFSAERSSTMCAPVSSARNGFNGGIFPSHSHASESQSPQQSQSHARSVAPPIHGWRPSSSHPTPVMMERSVSSAPIVRRFRGGSGARLAGTMSSTRSADGIADGMGTVAC